MTLNFQQHKLYLDYQEFISSNHNECYGLPYIKSTEIQEFRRYISDENYLKTSEFYLYLKNKKRTELIDKILNDTV